jgi:predicted lactoylglutathione lyase
VDELCSWVGFADRHPSARGVIMTAVFVNLPTTDLERSKAFYTAIGCDINPLFTDENAACVVWSEDIYFMILKRAFFATFTDKPIADPRAVTQVSVSFSRESRDDVDAIADKALAAGGSEPKPAQDYGFMYSRDIDDPDGNSLGFLYMTPEAVENGPEHVAESN